MEGAQREVLITQTRQAFSSDDHHYFRPSYNKKSLELEALRAELSSMLPLLGKHKIEGIQQLIAEHYNGRFKGSHKPPKYGDLNKGFTEEQLQAFLGTIGEPKYRLLFSYMACIGLRIGEACKVNARDIDFQTREIRVNSEKTRKIDLLIIPIRLFQQTQEYLAENKARIEENSGYFFYPEPGKSTRKAPFLAPIYVRKRFREYAVRSGLNNTYAMSEERSRRSRQLHLLTSHSLRHYAITKFARQTNGNLLLSSKFARHLEPSTTLTYINTDKRELFREIDRTFSNIE